MTEKDGRLSKSGVFRNYPVVCTLVTLVLASGVFWVFTYGLGPDGSDLVYPEQHTAQADTTTSTEPNWKTLLDAFGNETYMAFFAQGATKEELIGLTYGLESLNHGWKIAKFDSVFVLVVDFGKEVDLRETDFLNGYDRAPFSDPTIPRDAPDPFSNLKYYIEE